jgi:DNA-binding MarR family transcriptional regulator
VEETPVERWALPSLLRSAQASISNAVRRSLAAAGMDDLPPNGPFVVGAIGRHSAPLAAIVRQLGGSKQAAGQLVDTLVLRGYLERSIDPQDRRRLIIGLTARGEAAAAMIRSALARIEKNIELEAGGDRVETARTVLAGLVRTGRGDT